MPFDGPAADGPVKVAFTRNTFEFELAPAVETALLSARDALADAGYQVEEVEPPLLRESANDGFSCLFGEVKALMGNDIRKLGSKTLNDLFDRYFTQFKPYEGDDLLKGMARRSHYIREWLVFMQDYPLVLTPFMPTPTYKWDRDTEGDEGLMEVLGASIYSVSMNYMGLPAGNIPASYNDGLPIGVQIVGRRFREDMILDACEAVEQRIGVMAEKLFERG